MYPSVAFCTIGRVPKTAQGSYLSWNLSFMRKKIDFEIMKIRADVYATMFVENRVLLFALMAFQDTDIPSDWDWDTDNPDVRTTYGVAEFYNRMKTEINTAFDSFFITYYDCSLYGDGNPSAPPTTVPDLDLTISEDELDEIRKIMTNAIKKEFQKQKMVYGSGDCYSECLALMKKNAS